MDETRSEMPGLSSEDDGDSINGDKSGTDPHTGSTGPAVSPTNMTDHDLQVQQAQDPKTEARQWTPGEANPALTETEGYIKGTVSTADFLRVRGSAEAQLPGALEHRDNGFTGRAAHHGHPAPPLRGVTSDADLYDREERHVMHEEPEMHVFAPGMLNLSSEGGTVNGENEENEKKEE